MSESTFTIDANPKTPGAWLELMEAMLDERIPAMLRYDRYGAGQHDLQFATSKFKEAFGELFGPLADNWCKLIIAAVCERLNIDGFRFGDDEDADKDAWRTWQHNKLRSRSKRLHRATVRRGYGYAMVGPGRPGKPPRITVESALEVIVVRDPGDTDRVLSGLKRWRGRDGFAWAVVYLPDSTVTFRSKERIAGLGRGWGSPNWAWQDTQLNPLGEVPIVEFVNDPDEAGNGHSELEDAIPLQDAINKLVLDMLVASEFAAFRQRLLSGIEIPKDDDGKPLVDPKEYIEGLISSVSRTWAFPSGDVKAQEFSATDLKNFVTAIEMLVQHLAAITRTPPHYLLGQSGAFPSGESLQSTETGLVSKAEDKQVEFGESWEDVQRKAFKWRALELERQLRDQIALRQEFHLGDGDDVIDRLRERLAAIEATVAALNARGQAPAATPDELLALFGHLDDLDRALANAEDDEAETIWRNPESRNWAQLIDGLSKLGGETIGAPKRWLWEQIPDVRPKDLPRMKRMHDEEQAEAQALMFSPVFPAVAPEPVPA